MIRDFERQLAFSSDPDKAARKYLKWLEERIEELEEQIEEARRIAIKHRRGACAEGENDIEKWLRSIGA